MQFVSSYIYYCPSTQIVDYNSYIMWQENITIRNNQLKWLMGPTHFNSVLQIKITAFKQFNTSSHIKLMKNYVN